MRSLRARTIRWSLIVLTLALTGVATMAQSAPATNPQEKPHKQKKEADNPLREWAEKDVAPIITSEELRAWKLLRTDAEREAFIAWFWGRRDPDPDTTENEYRDGYYERMAYVNEHYTSGKPGYLTDRGRIYLVYGKPDEVESHPSGGSYEMPSYQGGDSIMAYPFEIWFYRHVPNVANGVELEFVDPTGSGEYRLANSPDEKNALANVPGHQSPNQGGPATINTSGYQRAQDNPIDRMIINVGMSQPPPVDYDPNGIAGGDVAIDNSNPINVDIRADMFRQSDQSAVAAITVQTSNSDLVFVPSGGAQTARLNIFGRITLVSGQPITTFQDVVTTTTTSSEMADTIKRRSAYQKVLPLPPGIYKVDIIVRDLNSSSVGRQQLSVTVPRFNDAKVALSSIVLAARLEELGSRPPGGMFSIGDKKVLPNISGEFHQGQGVGLYAQIYNAEIDQTTLRPSVDVSYAILRNGAEVYRQAEDWRGMSEAGQRLTLARILPTDGLAPGAYQVVISVKDQVSGATLSRSANFTVVR